MRRHQTIARCGNSGKHPTRTLGRMHLTDKYGIGLSGAGIGRKIAAREPSLTTLVLPMIGASLLSGGLTAILVLFLLLTVALKSPRILKDRRVRASSSLFDDHPMRSEEGAQ